VSRLPLILLTLLFVAVPPLPAGGQANPLHYAFDLQGPSGPVKLACFPCQGSAPIVFQDLSQDSPTALEPGSPVDYDPFTHSTSFTVTTSVKDPGWFVQNLAPITSHAQDPPQTLPLQYVVSAQAQHAFIDVTIVGILEPNQVGAQPVNRTLTITLWATGFPSITPQGSAPQLKLGPRERGDAWFRLQNNGLIPRAIDFTLASNSCNMGVGVPSTIVLGPDETQEVHFSVQAPSDQFWYQSQTCLVAITGHLQPRPDVVDPLHDQKSVQFIVLTKVNGFTWDPVLVFWTVVLLALAYLLVLFVRRRKERLEEEVLGKPQKPWLIPVEKVYLAHLKRRDARAWYVLRHHLMEEEYRSSLLWYKAYKAATKGDRKKERLILQQERAYARWTAKWEKAVAQPLAAADKFEAKLQRKLDRLAHKRLRKARRKWRKGNRSLRKAHAKQVAKAGKRHEAAARKAARKGLPPPPQPQVAAAIPPPEPVLVPIPLAEHRWSKKAARFRRRMERRQGNLEVAHEKADARYVAKLRRRVQRIGRKLDDPEFAKEHPLLSKS